MRLPRTGPLKLEGAPRGRAGHQQPRDPSQTLLAGSQPWPWGLSTKVSASSPPPPLPPADVPEVLSPRRLSRPDVLLRPHHFQETGLKGKGITVSTDAASWLIAESV